MIPNKMTYDRSVFHIHCEHLGWWKMRRFVNFFTERSRNGQDTKEIIDTWNRYMTRPEDTVYYVKKDINIPLPISLGCEK